MALDEQQTHVHARSANPAAPTPLHLVVDADDVLRSRAAGASAQELSHAAKRWAAQQEPPVQIALVYRAPRNQTASGVHELDERTLVVTAVAEPTAEVIVREAQSLHGRGVPVLVVTTDWDLRMRLGSVARRLMGGGAFLRMVLPLADPALDNARPDCPRCDIPMRRRAADIDVALERWRCADFPFCTTWLHLDGRLGAAHDPHWSAAEIEVREDAIRARERSSRRRGSSDDGDYSGNAGSAHWIDGVNPGEGSW